MATSTPATDGRTGRTTDPALRAPVARPGSRLLHRLVWLRLGLLLSAPLAWMLLIYVAALAALLITSLWSVDSLSSEIDRSGPSTTSAPSSRTRCTATSPSAPSAWRWR